MLRFISYTIPLVILNVIRLLLFVVCLLPGFIRFAWYYYITSDRITLRYGQESIRQKVDIYYQRKIIFKKNKKIVIDTHKRRNEEEEEESLLDSSGKFNSTNDDDDLVPIIIFCTGGAWMIGYKMWGALTARILNLIGGYVVIIPDTRNYPQVTIPQMVNDMEVAIEWIMNNNTIMKQYGGDTKNVVIVGQSAGGHLACTTIFRNVVKRIKNKNKIEEKEQVQQHSYTMNIKGFIAISAPLNLTSSYLIQSFERLGLNTKFLSNMFNNQKDEYDPLSILQNLFSDNDEHSKIQQQQFLNDLPPISIYQGTKDRTVPYQVSESFYEELSKIIRIQQEQEEHNSRGKKKKNNNDDKKDTFEEKIKYVTYHGWSHTDPILEGPMDADHRLHRDIINDVRKWTTNNHSISSWPDANDDDDRQVIIMKERLCPSIFIQISRFVNPF